MLDKIGDISKKAGRIILSVLVVDLVDSTSAIKSLEPEDAQLFLDKCFSYFRDIIEANGGSIVHFTGDGAVAVFGWPSGHEHHADLAISAALQLVDKENLTLNRPDGNNIEIRIGVHSGTTIVRTIETGFGVRPDAIGNTVHVAAALEKMASSNEVIVSQSAIDLCYKEVITEPFSAFNTNVSEKTYRVKGHATRVQNRPKGRKLSPIIGRESELARVNELWPHNSKQIQSACFLGNPGIGKSRLLESTLEEARRNSIDTFMVFCNPMMRSKAYFVVSQIIQKLFRKNYRGTNFDQMLVKLELSETDKIISRHFVMEDIEQREMFTQKRVESALIRLIIQLIGDAPTIMCLEDIHHLDSESADLFFSLRSSQDVTGVTVIASSRVHGEPEARLVAQDVINVMPMKKSDMTALAISMLGDVSIEKSQLKKLVERADGVPFVLEQLIRSYLINKVPQKFDPLPQSIESSIHAQVYQLSPELRYSIQLLSVIGNDYTADELSKLMEIETSEFTRVSAELENKGLIKQMDDHSFRFSHDIILDAVRRTLHRTEKAKYHKIIFTILLANIQDWGVEDLTLAFHARESELLQKALEHYYVAARTAIRTSSANSLDMIFDEAMAVVERVGPEADSYYVDLVLMAFDSLQQIGKYKKINKYLPRAIEIARNQNRPDKECLGLGHLTTIRWYEGNGLDGRKSGSQAMALANKIDAPPLIFYTHFQMANVYYNFGELDKAIELQSALVARLTGKLSTAKLGASVIPGSISRSFLCYKMTDKGLIDDARKHGAEAIKIGYECNQPYSITMANMAMGRLLNAVGDYEQAEFYTRECYSYVHDHGLYTANASASAHLATTLMRMGRHKEAIQLLEKCFDSGTMPLASKFTTVLTYIAYYEALRLAGNLEGAENARQRALKISREIQDPISEAKALSIPARFDVLQGTSPQSQLEDLTKSVLLSKQFKFVLPHPMNEVQKLQSAL